MNGIHLLFVGDTARSFVLHCHTLGEPKSIPYMHPSSRRPISEAMQRSQSTPNVGVRPTEQQRERPRRTKTSIDFLAVPSRSALRREKCVDPFNLAGFFPSGLRQSDQEPSGWWMDEGPEEGSEELARELVIEESHTSSLGSQRVLFGREDQPTEAVIKHEDKLGVLSVCAHFPFHTQSSVIMASGGQ